LARRSNAKTSGASAYIATTETLLARRSNAKASGASAYIATTAAMLIDGIGRFARRLATACLGLFAACCVPAIVQAQTQDWPQRPVRVIVPFAAGGNIDVIARLTCQRMSEVFGQQFVVENRVGGNGTIAAESVAHASPDGYTLFWAGPAVVSIFPAITKAAYDPVKDFKPVSVIGVNPQVLVVNARLPIANVAAFIAYVKAQPQRLPYAGGGGPGSLSNLLMALFLKRAGLEMTSVSYRGTAPAMTDLVAGHIPTMFVPLSEALPQAHADNIRMLGVSSAKRARQAPDVPTIAESGFPGFHAESWNGVLAPAATPDAIVNRLAAEIARAAREPKFVERLDQEGVDPLGSSPTETAKFIAADMALWSDAVKIAGVSLQ
jgi:tripartite-type tricarboxylate transporter receptor subunit TctC